MPTWEPWLIFVGSFIATIGLLAVILRQITGFMRQVLVRRIAESFAAGERLLLQDLSANFIGRQSAGGMQLRGNGALVLTSGSLEFLMLWPNRRIRIPVSSITGTSVVRSHCGRTIGRDLLKVQYMTGAGEDSMAWYVPDVRGWQNQLDTVRLADGVDVSAMFGTGGGN